MKRFREKNYISLFIVVGLFIAASFTLFQVKYFQNEQSQASGNSPVYFVDLSGNIATQTTSPTVNIILVSPWVAQLATGHISSRHHSLAHGSSTETVAGTSAYTIYDDQLENGWVNGSYKTNVTFNNASPVFFGTRSIRAKLSGGGGLEFNAPSSFSSPPYSYVQFSIHATAVNEDLDIYAEDSNFSTLGNSVRLANYNGYPSTTGWTTYTIPLADLGASKTTLGDITIQNSTNNVLPPFYVDQVQLISTINTIPSVVPTNLPTSQPVISLTPTPLPTTASVILAEDSGFTTNMKTISQYTSNPMATTFTFSNSNLGTKTLYVKFVASNGATQVYTNSIELIAAATPTPSSLTPTLKPSITPIPTLIPNGAMNGLHVSGSSILNGSGQHMQQHGVNFSGFEYSCLGGSLMNDGPIPPSQAEVNGMKAWNINTVRIPMNEDCWLGLHGIAPAVSGANYQNAITNFVNLLTSNNISVILNLHFNGDGNTKAVEQEPMADRAHSNDFWASVASKFKGNNAVMFEPYNEPHLNDITITNGTAWGCWRDGGCTVKGNNAGDGSFVVAGMQEMVNAIRGTGATNIVIVTGEDWGADLSGWGQYKPLDSQNQLAAGWHTYGDGLSCQTVSCWNTTLAAVLASAPILTTEIGEFDCNHTYIDQVMGWLDSHNSQGYYAWTWGPFSCKGDPALISDSTWTGTSATNAYGSGYKNHLLTRP